MSNISKPNHLVSIIVPVYNVETYLDYCLQSILNQTYENIEVILIDDGSTDSSGRKIEEYASNDKRIIAFHKENGGLSSARNYGLGYAKGDYITFIDSDDYVRKDYIERLLNLIIDDKSDLAICMAKKVTDNEDYCLTTRLENHYKYSREEIQKNMIARRVPFYAHGKLYSKHLLATIRFPEGRLFEDIPTVWEVLKIVDNASFCADQLYFYRQRIGSIVNTEYKHGRMDQLYFSEKIMDEVRDNIELFYSAQTRCFFAACDNYTYVTKDFPEDIEYLKKSIKKYRKGVLRDNGAGIKLKTMCIVSFFSIQLVKAIGKKYKQSVIKRIK